MLSILSISYLFLGGAGAGALFLLTVLDIRSPWASSATSVSSQFEQRTYKTRRLSTQRRQGKQRLPSFDPQLAYRGLFSAGYGAGFVVLALGTLCLLADLGRVDRVLLLFMYPTSSLVSLGTYALTLLMLSSTVLAAIWLFCIRVTHRWIINTLRGVILFLSMLIMLYTGLLFQSMGTGLLIGSVLIPILFVLSSLSTGSAVLFIVFSLTRGAQGFRGTNNKLLRVDFIIIALEILITCALVIQALLTTGFAQTTQAVLEGSEAMVFWLGFVACGLIVPFLFELLQWRGWKNLLRQSDTYLSFVLVAALVLIGGFCLRWCVVMVGFPIFDTFVTVIGG